MIAGHVIFCDDVREEVGGKTTYVGAYKSDLIVNGDFPVTLPKLAVCIIWSQSMDEDDLPVEIEVSIPGREDPIIKAELPLQRVEAGTSEFAPEERLKIIEVVAMISPLTLEGPGTISVIATRDKKRLSLRKLGILAQGTDAQSDD